MKQDRKWQIETGPSVKQEAGRLGLIEESWEIVKLIPTAPLNHYEKIEVAGTKASPDKSG